MALMNSGARLSRMLRAWQHRVDDGDGARANRLAAAIMEQATEVAACVIALELPVQPVTEAEIAEDAFQRGVAMGVRLSARDTRLGS